MIRALAVENLEILGMKMRPLIVACVVAILL